MEVGPPDEPARGAECAICWFVIVMMTALIAFNPFLAIASPDVEFDVMHVLLPLMIGFIGLARLNGRGRDLDGPCWPRAAVRDLRRSYIPLETSNQGL